MLDHDILIIGAGLAGMRAALSAKELGADVAVVSKVHPVRSHSNAAQGGINAALTDRGDDWRDHAYDTIKGSDFLGDQDAIALMCEEAGGEVIAMEHMGAIFNRDEEGRLGTRAFGGQREARTFFVADFTGQALLHVLYEQILKAGALVYEEWFVLSLIVRDGKCGGAVIMDIRSGKIEVVRAKAVILAAGGLGRVFEPSTNALICTGDGMSLGYRAGASLMDMEMVQYHPTTLKGSGVLISEAARGEGAYLLNSENDRFMLKYAPEFKELASRDVVSRCEQTEINEGRGIDGCVLLDVRHLGEKYISERLSQIRELAMDFANVDMAKEPVPIMPGMHYQMGGVKANVDGETGVPGLYAAGEVACVSVHGGNRLGANSLLDTLVFGRRAGLFASKHANHQNDWIVDTSLESELVKQSKSLVGNSRGSDPDHVKASIRNILREFGWVIKDEPGLIKGLEEIRKIRDESPTFTGSSGKELVNSFEAKNMLLTAELLLLGSLDRKESRGAFFRDDYPSKDDANYLCNIVYRSKNNAITLEHDVPDFKHVKP